jgi:hypothetical protein
MRWKHGTSRWSSTALLFHRESHSTTHRHVAKVFADCTFLSRNPALIDGAERNLRLREFQHRMSAIRRQSLIHVISEAVAVGDIADYLDPELGALALLGPIIDRRLMSEQIIEPKLTKPLIETAIGPPRIRTRSQS